MPNNEFLLFTTKHDVDEATFHDILDFWSTYGEVHNYLLATNGTTDALRQRYRSKPKLNCHPSTTIETTSRGAGIRFRDEAIIQSVM